MKKGQKETFLQMDLSTNLPHTLYVRMFYFIHFDYLDFHFSLSPYCRILPILFTILYSAENSHLSFGRKQ